ncbi:adapter molecule crk [Hydra vulgaris]|uniref:adapter molecule crk n=1 Tax=Hydra vulgaris TaxID=6087 RepID=UPI0002B45E7E|nr:adapter molecule crk [Hydra vulgaris]
MTEEVLQGFNWYHNTISREEAQTLLNGCKLGSFLVRRRKGVSNEYVLSVSEKQKISHYIIMDVNGMYFKIGEQRFADIASIIEFYKQHTIDTTMLTDPVIKIGETAKNQPLKMQLVKVRAKFNFPGNDPEDLPFHKGDILTIIRREEDKWWLARDNAGREGMIPVPYIELIKPASAVERSVKNDSHSPVKPQNYAQPKQYTTDQKVSRIPNSHTGPLIAVAIKDREPNFYDETLLGFKKGDKIEVLKTSEDGSWEGKNLSNLKVGFFPFNHVRLLVDQ